MRSILWILTSLSFLLAKDITFKLQTLKNDSHQLISISGASNNQNQPNFERSSRDDTSTIWLDDLEGDISGWTVAPEWELTDESSFSPSNSFHMDDDNYDVVSSIVSPLISVPELTSESELLKLNFA